MKLDYELTNTINNYKVDGVAKYDCVGHVIWFSKQELCNEVRRFLGIEIPLETKVEVTKKQLESVWRLLNKRKDLLGTYGDHFLNSWIW